VTQPRSLPVQYVPAEPAETGDLPAGLRHVVNRINDRLAGAAGVREIVDELFDQTRPFFPCDRLSLAFLADDGRRLVSYHTRADYEPLRLRAGYSEPLAGSSLAEVFETGACRIIADLPAYLAARPDSASTKLLVEEGVRSSLTCPLNVEDRRVGVLFRSSRHPGAYGQEEVAGTLAVARRVSQAAEKAYLIEQLRSANQAYGEMLRFVSHELRNPVSAIMMETELLTDGYLGELSDAQAKRVANIRSRSRYLLGLISDYLDLARIESGRLAPQIETVDFAADVVDEALDVVAVQAEAKNMTIERELDGDLAAVDCDARLMKIAAVNLAGNAAKYGREGGRIRVSARRTDGRVELAVWNEGPGFPPDQRDRLFRRFSRLDTPELRKEKGSGVGLYAVWHIAAAHGGKVWARSESGQWAEFGLWLPQPLPPEVTDQLPPA
jgi:hypothetical protein